MGHREYPHANGYTNGNGYVNGHVESKQVNGLPPPHHHHHHHHVEDALAQPLAIVGMACHLPGDVKDPAEFWTMCARRRNGWSEIPKSRFNAAAYYHPNPGRSGTSNPKGASFLRRDLALFDAPFFNISLSEAQSLDPQQRLMLECSYESLENAGIAKETIGGGNVGVFVGSSFSDYELNNLRDTDNVPMYQTTGNSTALLSNRISYFFDLKGPSLTVDTACSSSLVALHLACQSLRSGESSAAIVGGAHINLLPDFFVSMSLSRLFSDSGRCFAFDEKGQTGFGRGEGAACLVLKPLDSALKAGDPIRALVVGSGTNQDGRTQGITMPSVSAQESLIRSVYKTANLDPRDTGYVEAHGTGTKVGDPVEATALHAVFGEGRTKRQPLYIGGVKPNIGHLEGASGVVSVIRTVMMLERGFVLPNCDFDKVKDDIPLDEWNIKVPTKQLPWPRGKRYASVNNFGYGGTNAHVVLAKAPPANTQLLTQRFDIANGLYYADTEMRSPLQKVFVLSGNDEQAAYALLHSLGIYCEQNPEAFDLALMDNLAYTLGQRRSSLPWRVAISAGAGSELVSKLAAPDTKPRRSLGDPSVGFLFTGQGAQWNAMGRDLMKTYPIFAETMHRADQHISSLGATFSIIDELLKDADSSSISEAQVSQPACTAVQIALTALLQSWGVHPIAVVGHSSGEIGAAYAAGIFCLEDCMSIAYWRGVTAKQLEKVDSGLQGAMMAVGAGEEEMAPYLHDLKSGQAVVACINSDSSVTVSGDESAIVELQSILTERSIFNRRLQVGVAYHSHHMKRIANLYRSHIAHVVTRESTVSFHSSVYGERVPYTMLGPDYWVANLVSPVRFSQGLRSLMQEGRSPTGRPIINTLVEVGPHPALEGPSKQILKADDVSAYTEYIPTLRRKHGDVSTMQQLAATLFVRGLAIKFALVNFPVAGEEKPSVVTNLPKYPWNLSTRYWHESRLAQNHLHKPFGRSDILGSLGLESDDLEPRWRNVIRTDDHPWLRDHVVQGNNVYPMAGYLAMAMEASAQHAALKRTVPLGFSFREVTLGKALIISETSAVETTLSLRPLSEGTRASSDVWSEFRIFSWINGRGWDEHCRGLISVQTTSGAKSLTDAVPVSNSAMPITEFESLCLQKVNVAEMYGTVNNIGVCYGPLFRGITDCQIGGRRTILDFEVPLTSICMPNNHETDCIIHPCTLDMCLQAVWPLLGAANDALKGLHLPSFVKKLTVSQPERIKPGTKLRVFGQQTVAESRHAPIDHDIFVTDALDTSKILLQFDGLTLTPVRDVADPLDTVVDRHLCFKLELEPYFDFMDVGKYTLPRCSTDTIAAEKRKTQILEKASYFFLERALQKMESADVSSFKEHHQKFFHSMQRHCEDARSGALAMQTPDWLAANDSERMTFIETIARAQGAAGEMICRMGEAIPQILRQEVEPLSLMLENGLLERYYTDLDSFRRSYEHAAVCLDRMATMNPDMTILEVGAGTGGATLPMLECLGGGLTGKPARFSHFTYTDVSSGFFEQARAKLNAWNDLLEYKTLDISQDPVNQGYEPGSYDLIIACNVLHTTPRMDVTMTQTRKLLKPGGKLLLIEETSSSLRQFIYETLPGWWHAEESDRQNGPTMSVDAWSRLLHDTGFSGVDVCLDDYPGAPEKQGSLMISTAKGPPKKTREDVVIVTSEDAVLAFPVTGLADGIEAHTGTRPEITSLTGGVDVSGKLCIVLYELDSPKLSQLSPELFRAIQQLLMAAEGVLWVVREASSSSKSPESNLAIGLARTVRSESNLHFATLDLDSSSIPPDDRAVAEIVRVFSKVFSSEERSILDSGEMEWVARDDVIFVPRVAEDSFMNDIVRHNANESLLLSEQKFGQNDRPLTMALDQPGMLDSIYFTDDDDATKCLPDDYIKIEVQYAGLNFKDVMNALGQLNSNHFGLECSGVVKECGRNVVDFAVGDQVCAVSEACLARYTRCPATCAIKVPASVDIEAAATIPVVFCTAYYSLVDVARLQRGESVLIHAAAGGVGQAAIMIANFLGAEIYATVGSHEKKQHLMKTYNIPESRIFYSRDTSFADDVRRATNGAGVDVALNSLAGESLRATWECVAPLGRFVELGKRDIKRNTRLEMAQFDHNISFSSVDLLVIIAKRPDVMKRLMADVFALFESGQAAPVMPRTCYTVSNVHSAFSSLQTGKAMGKVAIKIEDDAVVKVNRRQTNKLFRTDASYIIVGGTGGLGRSMAYWMAMSGARHLVLVSRSGGNGSKIEELVNEVKSVGTQIVVCQCDISNKLAVEEVVGSALKQLPPVAGAIYGAMVLDDVLFEKMSYEQYDSVIKPKCNGVWNLHNLLLSYSLDFFVTLSSVAGVVGNRGQAAYAATGTFLDAFVSYRQSLGLPCVTFDLAPVEGIGYLAENFNKQEQVRDVFGSDAINEAEFHRLLAAAITGELTSSCGGHCITGVNITETNREAFWTSDPRFSLLLQACKDNERRSARNDPLSSSAPTQSLAETVKQQLDIASVKNTIVEALTDKVSMMLMRPAGDILPTTSLGAYGLDSLVAIEFRNWISRELGAGLQILEILAAESLVDIVGLIVDRTRHLSENFKSAGKVMTNGIHVEA